MTAQGLFTGHTVYTPYKANESESSCFKNMHLNELKYLSYENYKKSPNRKTQSRISKRNQVRHDIFLSEMFINILSQIFYTEIKITLFLCFYICEKTEYVK